MRFLRTNTAVIITVGPFYDKTDGVVIETALTITNERITLTADTDAGSAPTNILDNITGATSGTANDLNYITGNDAGMMQLELAAADVNRLGRMFLSITDAANHCPVFMEFMVLPAMIYDAFVLGTDVLDSSLTQILGTAAATPATAGVLDVNVKNMNNVAATAITTIKAVQGLATDGVIPTATTVTNAVTVSGDLSATMKTSVTTAASAATPVATVSGDLSATMKTSVTTAATAATPTIAAYTGNTPQTGDVYPKVDTEVATLVTGVADIQARIPAALTAGGNIKAGVQGFLDSVFTEGAAGRITAAVKQFFNIATPASTMDVVARVTLADTVTGVTGLTASNLDAATSSLAPAATALSTAVWTSARAGYIDNLNGLRIKKNTALAGFPFLMVLASDHITPATGLTVAVQRMINGAAFGNSTNTPATEVSSGLYTIDLSAADLNGNTIVLKMTAATADQRTIIIITEP